MTIMVLNGDFKSESIYYFRVYASSFDNDDSPHPKL